MSTRRLSAQLSPAAKKQVMFSDGSDSVDFTVEFAPTANLDALRSAVEKFGGTVTSLSAETRLMNISLPVGQVEDLAEAAGVSYVSVPERYSS